MPFRSNAYATVWETKPSAKYTDVRLSCSSKNKTTGQYESDFSGFVRFIGDAHKMAAGLKTKDRIQLGEVSCTNTYSKENKTTYYNFQCFSFTPAENGHASTAQSTPTRQVYRPEVNPGADEELPFN